MAPFRWFFAAKQVRFTQIAGKRSQPLSLFNELKRRNVIRVGIAYAVVAWLILQFADVILSNTEAPNWVFQVILLLLGIGLLLALFFAWAFELTADGLKREHEVDRETSITPQTGKKLDRAIIVVLALAVGYFAFDKFVQSPEPDVSLGEAPSRAAVDAPAESAVIVATEKSIAVLPLANRSAREEDKYFTDGMHDDLLTQLAKISSLKVISRTSVMRYRDTEMSIPEIADQLGVSTILEGGVQRAGDQIRINVQLIAADTDEHLWAETYNRKMTAENLFSIQSEITEQIVASLKATLTPDEAARINVKQTDNLKAFEEQMKGQQLLTLRTVPGIEQGKAHFERAIELDPEYTQAIVGLANAYHLLNEYAGWPAAESLDLAMDLVTEALVIDPEFGEAFMVRGEIWRHHGEFDKAEADFETAMDLIPGNASLYHWYSFVKSQQNQPQEAHALLRRAHELNPMSGVIHANYAAQPFFFGRDEETLMELERVKQIHPEYPFVYSMEAWVYRSHGDPVGSLRANLRVVEIDPANTRATGHCFDYINLDAREKALECAANDQSAGAVVKGYIEMVVDSINGDREAAASAFESSLDADDHWDFRGSAAMIVQNYDIAGPIFEEDHPAWFSDTDPIRIEPDDINDAISVAVILNNEGNADRAETLLQAALDTMKPLARNRGMTAYGFDDVSAYALLGETDAALDALEQCARIGYLTGWQGLRYMAQYDSIREEPRFMAAVSKLSAAADAARERAEAEGLL